MQHDHTIHYDVGSIRISKPKYSTDDVVLAFETEDTISKVNLPYDVAHVLGVTIVDMFNSMPRGF